MRRFYGKNIWKKGAALLMSICLMGITVPVTVSAEGENGTVIEDTSAETTVSAKYIDENGEEQSVDAATQISADSTELSTGWYIVNSETVDIEERITVSGDVKLILADGCTLNAKKGITVLTGNSFTVYAQSGGTGALNATGDGYSANPSGIGAAYPNNKAGTITIVGGKIYARGGYGATGIGGSYETCADKIVIMGGDVTAVNTSGGGSAIGGGFYCYGGTIVISGGIVHTEHSNYRSGYDIGGDYGCDFSTGSNGSAIIYASSINSNLNSASCIVYNNKTDGKVYGNTTLKTNLTVSDGESLTIQSRTSLTIAEGVTLTRAGGTITNNGTVYVAGSISNPSEWEGNGDVQYKINITGGTASVEDKSVEYAKEGSEITLTATGIDDDESVRWIVNGEYLTGDSNTFSMPAEIVTVELHRHTVITDAAVAANCTTTGKTQGSHCSVCGDVVSAQKTISANGHDFSGEWTVTKEATATTDGRMETLCKKGCGTKNTKTIQATGTTEENTTNGTLSVEAEIAADAPVESANLDNNKSDFIDSDIFTKEEKTAIEEGNDAKVYLQISALDTSEISAEDKSNIESQATLKLGTAVTIKYMDVSLFKQVGTKDAETVHNPGTDIEVTLKLPTEMINKNTKEVRKYRILRLHDGEITVISGTFNSNTHEFTFKTDKFSTYAIAYEDVVKDIDLGSTPATQTIRTAGATIQLNPIVTPATDAEQAVTYTSSNEEVATVDASGKVTAVGNGTAIITISTADGAVSKTITINVAFEEEDESTEAESTATASAEDTSSKTVKTKAPNTGDQTSILLPIVWMLASGIGLAMAWKKRKND